MFVTVVAVGLTAGWVIRARPVEVATVGRPAPEFEVALLDGGRFSLRDHLTDAGTPLVVNLWASWCKPCRTEMPEISAFAEANPGVTVVGVAVEDTLPAATAFADEVRPDYPLAYGDAAFEAAYPRIGLPVTYVIGADGVVTALHNGIVDAAILDELVDR